MWMSRDAIKANLIAEMKLRFPARGGNFPETLKISALGFPNAESLREWGKSLNRKVWFHGWFAPSEFLACVTLGRVVPPKPNLIDLIFGPELKGRYDNVIVNDLTGAKQYLWRGGAQAILKYAVIGDALPEALKGYGFLSSLHGQTTVSWLTSSFDGRSYGYFNSSLTYNLDPDGYVGLSGSYTRGRSEDTGRKQDIWKLSLTGKL